MIRTSRRTVIIALTVLTLLAGSVTTSAAEHPVPRDRSAKLILARAGADRQSAGRSSDRSSVPGPADVTGDGMADAVVRDAGVDRGTLRLFAHDGTPADNPYPDAVTLGGSWAFADALLLGDVTGDGRVDVVTRDPAGELAFFPHDADAAPDPWPTRIAVGTGWSRYDALLLGDVTGDGRPDLIAREPGAAAGTLWIFPHTGDPEHPYGTQPIWAGTGWNLADALLLGDVTGDQFPDVVVRDGSGALWIYPHDGAGSTAQNPYTGRIPAGTGWPTGQPLLLADVTGDGRPDLITRAGDRLRIHPHTGAGSGTVWSGEAIDAGSGWGFADLLVTGDVTGDGRPDLLGRVNLGRLWVYPGDGRTPWQQRFAAGEEWAFADRLLLGDATGDGSPDLIARDPGSGGGTLWLYPGDGATDSDPWTGDRVFAGTGWNLATTLVLGDLTGDQRPDLLVRDRDGELWVYPHDGSVGPGNPWTVPRRWVGSGWTSARELRLADVDGDGRADLVDLEGDGTLWVYPTGAGSPYRIAGDWSLVGTLDLGDVDGDGRPDLVVIDEAGAVTWYPHSGGEDPWPAGRAAATDWTFVSALLL